MMRETGVNGVTAARGAIGNPWIFAQARASRPACRCRAPPSVHQQREVIREHYRLAEEVTARTPAAGRCASSASSTRNCTPTPLAVRDAFIRRQSRRGVALVLDRFYAEDRPGNYAPAGPDGPWSKRPNASTRREPTLR